MHSQVAYPEPNLQGALVSLDKVFRWGHLLLENIDGHLTGLITSLLEVDETYFNFPHSKAIEA